MVLTALRIANKVRKYKKKYDEREATRRKSEELEEDGIPSPDEEERNERYISELIQDILESCDFDVNEKNVRELYTYLINRSDDEIGAQERYEDEEEITTVTSVVIFMALIGGIFGTAYVFREQLGETFSSIADKLGVTDETKEEIVSTTATSKTMTEMFGREYGVSSEYGNATQTRRKLFGESFHSGIDIKLPVGTPIRAPFDGKVVSVWGGETHQGGIQMKIVSKDGTQELGFAHLSKRVIEKGEFKAGDVIAYSGNSGRSKKGNKYAAHLHMTYYENGTRMNPRRFLEKHGGNGNYENMARPSDAISGADNQKQISAEPRTLDSYSFKSDKYDNVKVGDIPTFDNSWVSSERTSNKGVRLKNLGNVKWDENRRNDPWKGSVQKNYKKGEFIEFSDYYYGIRAIWYNFASSSYFAIKAYGIGKKEMTTEQIIYKYAPKSDGNDPESYLDFLQTYIGIPRNQRFRWDTRYIDLLSWLIHGIIRQEQSIKIDVGYIRAVGRNVFDELAPKQKGSDVRATSYSSNSPNPDNYGNYMQNAMNTDFMVRQS